MQMVQPSRDNNKCLAGQGRAGTQHVHMDLKVEATGTNTATKQMNGPICFPSNRKQRDLGSNLLRLSFHFKSCGLWTLSCDIVPHN